MNFQTIKWTAIIGAICVAYWKIFGPTGVVVSLVIATLILFLLYTFQNKILYIPGTILFTKIFLTLPILRSTTPMDTFIHPSTDWIQRMLKLQHLTISG